MSTLAIGGSKLRPLPLVKVTASSPANLAVSFTAYSTIVNHGAVTGGSSKAPLFDIGQTVTSSSGGSGTVVAATATSAQLNPVAGVFLAADTLTQAAGPNAGATATQAGASSAVGPFTVGDTLESSSGGKGRLLSVAAGTLGITGPGGAPAIPGTFLAGDTLTQTTGGAAGATAIQSVAATALGLLAAQAITLTYDLGNFINGRVRGNFHQDVAAAVTVLFGNDRANMDLAFAVPQDPLQPNFQYPFDVIVIQPFCQISVVNGAAASAFFRGFVSALPV